jgi:hypothetical protein
MSKTVAQIDGAGTVLRVIIAPTVTWCTTTLGGTWRDATNKTYPGIGWTYRDGDFHPPVTDAQEEPDGESDVDV